MAFSRRDFIKWGGAAALPLVAPTVVWSGTGSTAKDVLIVVFQRGGADALNIVPPYGDGRYYDLRPNVNVPEPESGAGAALDLDGFFGLHPSMQSLKSAYDSGSLAFVHAAGSPDPTRSHFDAQDFMELGFLGKSTVFDGWVNRHLQVAQSQEGGTFRAVGFGQTVQLSMRGPVTPVGLKSLESYDLVTLPGEYDPAREAILAMYSGSDLLANTTGQLFGSIDELKLANPAQYEPANGAVYPDTAFGQSMKQIGQLIRADVGVETVAVDSNGWDHHDDEAPILSSLLTDLSDSLAAFNQDMGSDMANITIVAMSEFGRRAYENGSAGTDHGHGGLMFALGGNVNGGQVYGDWPGLQEQNLSDGDLQVATDFRTVLGELLEKRMGSTDLGYVFPQFTGPPHLGIFS